MHSYPNARNTPHIAVVGAGIGGLVAAAELAHHGARVTLLERGATVGGKMRQGTVDELSMDVGPTVLTMPWIFEQIAQDLGKTLSDWVELTQVEILARHAWADGSRLDLFADPERSTQAIAQFAGESEAQAFRKFCKYAQGIYEASEAPFIKSERPTLASLFGTFGLFGLARLRRIDSMRTMWRALCDHFRDPRLRQLFARYATYYGCSPFRAPATLNIIAHIELQGVWLVKGGMYNLAQALHQQLRGSGVEILLETQVEEVLTHDNRVRGVRLRGGTTLDADAVVLNADVGAIGAGHLGSAAAQAVGGPLSHDRSLSALTLTMAAKIRDFPLAYHNVFFSEDYHREFEDLFDKHRLPQYPTVYVCAQDRNASNEPQGRERLFWIINAPPKGGTERIPPENVERCIVRAKERLQKCGLTLLDPQHIATTPHDFESAFPGTGGSLYGMATHHWKAPMQRSGSRTTLPGLYLAGGSVHPGAGVPMSALSGRLAAQTVLRDFSMEGPRPCT